MRQNTAGKMGPPDERGDSRHATAVMTTLEESVSLFFRLRAVLEDIHGHSEISGSMRGVMRDLKQYGPMTVPQMARSRPVSRQHIQAIVNDLQQAELVELSENPRHKRSRLVQLTPTGEAALSEIVAREHAVLNEMDIPVSVHELNQANDVLARLRTMLESPDWRKTVRSVLYQDGETPENPWLDDGDEFGDTPPARIHRN